MRVARAGSARKARTQLGNQAMQLTFYSPEIQISLIVCYVLVYDVSSIASLVSSSSSSSSSLIFVLARVANILSFVRSLFI